MASSDPKYVQIAVRPEDRQTAEEVKRQGETWGHFLRRAAKRLEDEDW